MKKFKQGIVSEVKRQKAETIKQKSLQDKYHVKKDVMIVEKSNMAKFTINLLGSLIRLGCTIAILVLAAIGLTVLLYPNIRAEFLLVIRDVYSSLITMLR